MKLDPALAKRLQDSDFYLLVITVGLSALHLLWTWKISDNFDRMIIDALFWAAIVSLLWRKKDELNLKSDIISSFLGTLLIALVILKSLSLFWFETTFLRLVPILSFFGVALLASGAKGLKQYWREFLVILLLAFPTGFLNGYLETYTNIEVWTAKVSGFLLWYIGFQAYIEGDTIRLPNGAVEVFYGCTGGQTGLLLLQLSLLFVLTFSLSRRKTLLLPLASVFIAFLMSVIRVGIMAVVVSDRETFLFWHDDPGNSIFSTLAILLFGFLCRYMLQSKTLETSEAKEWQV